MAGLIAENEVDSGIKEAKAALRDLNGWVKPESKSVPLLVAPGILKNE